MAIPAGISTALVHLDAPVSFIGDPGQLHVTIKSSVPLVWAATGTPVANFIDNINPGEGMDLEVELPHTDQDGFIDGNGNAFKGWSYVVEITYEKSGEQVQFPTREFQILMGQDSVDLALVPNGESYVPVVAPILPVTSLEGFTGAVTLVQLSLDLVDNTRDADKPVSGPQQTALDLKADAAATQAALDLKSDVGHRHANATAAADGFMAAADKAKLDGATVAEVGGALVVRDANGNFVAGTISLSDAPAGPDSATRRDYVDSKVAGVTYGTLGVVPTSSLPPLAISEPFVVSSQAAMLALVAQRGDVAIRTDISRSYILASDSPGTLADWKLLTAAGDVVSVNGKTGTVVLAKADVGLDQVDNTSDVNKPLSTAATNALNAKAPTANPTFTGTVSGVTKGHVGLGNVDNTSDANKPVSTAQQTALDAKANKTDPIFTGNGIVYNLKPAQLRRARSVLGKALAGSGFARIAFVGDSTVVGAYGGDTGKFSWPARFKNFLANAGYPISGTGLVPCFNNYATAEPRITLYSGMVSHHSFSNMVENSTTVNGVQFDTTSTGETGTIMDVYYDNMSAPFDVNIDGGAKTRVTPNNTNTIGIYSVTGLSNATHQSIAWRVSGTMRILGFRLRNSNNYGITTYNAAISGAKTDSLASSDYRHVMQTSSTASGWSADLVFIMCETNDAGNAIPVATFKANLQTAINTAKGQSADIVLVTGFPLNGTDLTAYTQALYDLANTNDLPLIDLQQRWGTWAAANALGMFTDNAHPTAAGYADAGRAVYNAIGL